MSFEITRYSENHIWAERLGTKSDCVLPEIVML